MDPQEFKSWAHELREAIKQQGIEEGEPPEYTSRNSAFLGRPYRHRVVEREIAARDKFDPEMDHTVFLGDAECLCRYNPNRGWFMKVIMTSAGDAQLLRTLADYLDKLNTPQ